jgi:hypothetical protein
MHFDELKIRFIPKTLLHSVLYVRNFFEFLEGSKCVFYLKYELHTFFFYLIQKQSPQNFRPTFSNVVGCM